MAEETETTLPPERAQELIRDGAELLDVRGEDEHEAGHIPEDRHVPFDRLKQEVAGLDQGQPVVLYCRSGDRSGPTADALRASGFEAFSIDGGALAWTEQGLPFEGEVVERNVLPPA
jgi:rhodanese-related sulfurtransferase